MEVNPRFLQGNVDHESLNGFNTPYWADAVLADGPIRVDPVSDAFWSYDGGVWREDRKVVSRRLPVKMGRTFRNGNIAHVSAYLYARLLRDGKTIRPDEPETRFVSVPSGLFDVSAGEIVPHDPDVLTTYQLQVDPEFDSPTTEFNDFVNSVVHHDDRARVLDILAYLLLPGNPEQRAVMLCGAGRNGKGVLLSVVESIIGTQNAAHVSLQEMSRQFAAAEIYGKPVNIVGDIDGDHIAHTGKFKQMTGDDTVRMDVKHATAFAAKVWAVPVFSANQIPTSADTSHGYLRRWEVVEFPNTFDGSDTGLRDRLRAELPAIAGRLLRRAHEHPYRISTSESGTRAHDMFARRSDPVRTWLDETELTGFAERKDAYADYRDWIEDGNGKTALTKGNFYTRVTAVMGDPKTVKGTRGWQFGN
ncbi:MAG: hypothetical protein JST91_28190 [Actinobacteria bacterium]|nr:hypothetical protein [Actinomycetota bacterium]